jgi:hypothetical protein
MSKSSKSRSTKYVIKGGGVIDLPPVTVKVVYSPDDLARFEGQRKRLDAEIERNQREIAEARSERARRAAHQCRQVTTASPLQASAGADGRPPVRPVLTLVKS